MSQQGPKETRTTRYLRGTPPSHDLDRIVSAEHGGPNDPTFLPRLAWRAEPKVRYDPDQLCRTVRDAQDAMFFCDTSIFDLRSSENIWPALLNRPGKLVLPPQVLDELDPWLKQYPTHPAARAVRDRDPGILRLDPGSFPGEWQKAAMYYVNLLAIRKRLFQAKSFEFEQAHGRLPDKSELGSVRAEIQKEVGERGFMLAKKGAGIARPPRTFYTDETLVFYAIATALNTGKEVILLSKDEDIQEQFYKMLWLLDTHYRGMLLADHYATDVGAFTPVPLPDTDSRISECFVGRNNVLIPRSQELIHQILPLSFHFVGVGCWIVGERLSALTFGAEMEMGRVLSIKGKTGGLNSDRLGSRNCHLWLAPLNIPIDLRESAAIVEDRRVPISSTDIRIPFLDYQQAVNTGEGFTRLAPNSPVRSTAPKGQFAHW